MSRLAARFLPPFMMVGALMWTWHFIAHKVAERLVEIVK